MGTESITGWTTILRLSSRSRAVPPFFPLVISRRDCFSLSRQRGPSRALIQPTSKLVERVQKVFKIELGGRELIILPGVCIKAAPRGPSTSPESILVRELPGLESASEADTLQYGRRIDRDSSLISELGEQSGSLRPVSRAGTITSNLIATSGGFRLTNNRASIFSELSATSEESRQLRDGVLSPIELNATTKKLRALGHGFISPIELSTTSGESSIQATARSVPVS